jgi:hypothetical protein
MTRIKHLPEQLMGSEKSKNLLNSFGVAVETEMVPVPTKLLPAPTLYMPGKKGIFQYEGTTHKIYCLNMAQANSLLRCLRTSYCT